MPGRNHGFTIIEMIWVIVLMGLLGLLGVPRIRDALQKQSVRSARVAGTALVVKARAAAVQRGCRATVHMRSDGRMWVTSCRTVGAGLDTVGTVDDLYDRFGVTMTPTRDSVQYDPRGLSVGNQSATIRFVRLEKSDSFMINAVGKVVR